MRILGIDPGLTRLGYSVVEQARGGLVLRAVGTVTTRASDSTAGRLADLQRTVDRLIAVHEVAEVALERVFYNLNVKTAVPVIQSAGVVMAAAAGRGLPVHEYTPPQVKLAVAGSGSAGKSQVGYMVARLLGDGQAGPDAADACAVAICHLHSRRLGSIEANAAPAGGGR